MDEDEAPDLSSVEWDHTAGPDLRDIILTADKEELNDTLPAHLVEFLEKDVRDMFPEYDEDDDVFLSSAAAEYMIKKASPEVLAALITNALESILLEYLKRVEAADFMDRGNGDMYT